MTQSAALPSMFGRFTAILQDHEHLGTTLKQLRSMCAALEAAPPLLAAVAPLELLEDLAGDLSRHFAAEEADSYFGTIVDEAPPLAARIAQLTTEHTAMLGAIIALCRFADDTSRYRELASAARQLLAQLERHERDESLLMRELLAVGR